MTPSRSRSSGLRVVASAGRWLAEVPGAAKGCALTIGVFDGVHLGHQRILDRVATVARAQRMVAAAVTFDPHPLRVLRPADAPPLIESVEQRLAEFARHALDAAVVLTFDEALSRLSPEDFVRGILVDAMRMRAVLVGENFRFGHRQAGDVGLLRRLGAQWGFTVEIVEPVRLRGEVVSSTSVRQAIQTGDVTRAARLLGRPFALAGRVERGTGTGRRQVVPTLNLAHAQELLPARGVYVTETTVRRRRYASVTNVGVRPTFDGTSVVVESHLFRFASTLTTGEMEIRFLKRLRGEKKFSSAAALRRQIQSDMQRARAFFGQKTRSRPRQKMPAAARSSGPRTRR